MSFWHYYTTIMKATFAVLFFFALALGVVWTLIEVLPWWVGASLLVLGGPALVALLLAETDRREKQKYVMPSRGGEAHE